MSFSNFMSSWFLSRCRRFSIKRQNFQSVRNFHKNTSIHIISWLEYLLKLQINSRVYLVESFIRSIFFDSRCRSRARFDENEWTFKAYNVFDHYLRHDHYLILLQIIFSSRRRQRRRQQQHVFYYVMFLEARFYDYLASSEI